MPEKGGKNLKRTKTSINDIGSAGDDAQKTLGKNARLIKKLRNTTDPKCTTENIDDNNSVNTSTTTTAILVNNSSPDLGSLKASNHLLVNQDNSNTSSDLSTSSVTNITNTSIASQINHIIKKNKYQLDRFDQSMLHMRDKTHTSSPTTGMKHPSGTIMFEESSWHTPINGDFKQVTGTVKIFEFGKFEKGPYDVSVTLNVSMSELYGKIEKSGRMTDQTEALKQTLVNQIYEQMSIHLNSDEKLPFKNHLQCIADLWKKMLNLENQGTDLAENDRKLFMDEIKRRFNIIEARKKNGKKTSVEDNQILNSILTDIVDLLRQQSTMPLEKKQIVFADIFHYLPLWTANRWTSFVSTDRKHFSTITNTKISDKSLEFIKNWTMDLSGYEGNEGVGKAAADLLIHFNVKEIQVILDTLDASQMKKCELESLKKSLRSCMTLTSTITSTNDSNATVTNGASSSTTTYPLYWIKADTVPTSLEYYPAIVFQENTVTSSKQDSEKTNGIVTIYSNKAEFTQRRSSPIKTSFPMILDDALQTYRQENGKIIAQSDQAQGMLSPSKILAAFKKTDSQTQQKHENLRQGTIDKIVALPSVHIELIKNLLDGLKQVDNHDSTERANAHDTPIENTKAIMRERLAMVKVNEAKLTVNEKNTLWEMLPDLIKVLRLSVDQTKQWLSLCGSAIVTGMAHDLDDDEDEQARLIESNFTAVMKIVRLYPANDYSSLFLALKDKVDTTFLINAWNVLHTSATISEENDSAMLPTTFMRTRTLSGTSDASTNSDKHPNDTDDDTLSVHTALYAPIAHITDVLAKTTWKSDNFIWTLINHLPANDWYEAIDEIKITKPDNFYVGCSSWLNTLSARRSNASKAASQSILSTQAAHSSSSNARIVVNHAADPDFVVLLELFKNLCPAAEQNDIALLNNVVAKIASDFASKEACLDALWKVIDDKQLTGQTRRDLIKLVFQNPALLKDRQKEFTAKEIKYCIELFSTSSTNISEEEKVIVNAQYHFLDAWLINAEKTTHPLAQQLLLTPSNILNAHGHNDYVNVQCLRSSLTIKHSQSHLQLLSDHILYKSPTEYVKVRLIDGDLPNITDATAWKQRLKEDVDILVISNNMPTTVMQNNLLNLQNTLYLALNRGGHSAQWTLDVLFDSTNTPVLVESLFKLHDQKSKSIKNCVDTILNMVFLANPIAFLACFANQVPANNSDYENSRFVTWKKIMSWVHEQNIFNDNVTWLENRQSPHDQSTKFKHDKDERNSIDEAVREQVIIAARAANSAIVVSETKQSDWLGPHIEMITPQSNMVNDNNNNNRRTPSPEPSSGAKVTLNEMPEAEKNRLNEIVVVARNLKKVTSSANQAAAQHKETKTERTWAEWKAQNPGWWLLLKIFTLSLARCWAYDKPSVADDSRGSYSPIITEQGNHKTSAGGVNSADITTLLQQNKNKNDNNDHVSTRSNSIDSDSPPSIQSPGTTNQNTLGHLVADEWNRTKKGESSSSSGNANKQHISSTIPPMNPNHK